MLRYLKQKRRVILSILVSFLLAETITYALEYYEGKPDIESFVSQLTVSPETRTFTIQIRTKGPAYFRSVGRIFACFSNPYADYLRIFQVEMSFDNVSWVNVPFYSVQPDDYSEFADLGLLSLDELVITIYGKYYFPPQTTLPHPANISKEEISDSFQGFVVLRREKAPRDTVIRILVVTTFFGAFMKVLDLLVLRKER